MRIKKNASSGSYSNDKTIGKIRVAYGGLVLPPCFMPCYTSLRLSFRNDGFAVRMSAIIFIAFWVVGLER